MYFLLFPFCKPTPSIYSLQLRAIIICIFQLAPMWQFFFFCLCFRNFLLLYLLLTPCLLSLVSIRSPRPPVTVLQGTLSNFNAVSHIPSLGPEPASIFVYLFLISHALRLFESGITSDCRDYFLFYIPSLNEKRYTIASMTSNQIIGFYKVARITP